MKAIGIFSLLVQRLPFAASAESGPSGSVSSKLPIGASGTVRNVRLVIPFLLMNVSPCRSQRDSVALQHDDQFGELRAAVRDEVSGTDQRHGQDRCDRLAASDHGSRRAVGGIRVECRLPGTPSAGSIDATGAAWGDRP